MFESSPDTQLKPLVRKNGASSLAPIESLRPGAVFRLDTGDLVAVHFSAKRVGGNYLSCRIVAWQVDEEGDAQQDSLGTAVAMDFKHSAPPAQLAEVGIEGIAAALRDLIFGVPAPEAPLFPTIPFDQAVRDGTNVRHAIAAAKAMGPTVDLAAAVGFPMMIDGDEYQEYDLEGKPVVVTA